MMTEARLVPSTMGALQRSRRRRKSRGATVFIVILMATLMLGMGIFAVRAAAVTELDAGYDRENTQTDFILEHGVMLAAAQISLSPGAAATFIKKSTTGSSTNTCLSGAWFQPIPNYTYYCLPYNGPALANGAKNAQTNAGTLTPVLTIVDPSIGGMGLPDRLNPDNNIPGSLGYAAVTSTMAVELADAGEGRPPPGAAVGSGATSGLKYYSATLGAWGQVGPYMTPAELGAPPNGACAPGSEVFNDAITTAREVGRAFITLGPI